MKTIMMLFLLLTAAGWSIASDDSTAIRVKSHIAYLASDALEGRRAGTRGARLAAAYVAQQFASAGLLPIGDGGTYFQQFVFTSGVSLGKRNSLSVAKGGRTTTLTLDKDFRPFAFSSNGDCTGSLVVAGYGISSADLHYDDYAGVDVKDKIVLVLRYSPEGDNPRSDFAKYLPPRYKTLTAREKGAKALLIVTGSADDSTDELQKLKYDNSASGSGIPVFSVTRSAVDAWLGSSYPSVDSIQSILNSSRKPASFEVPGVTLSLSSEVIEKKDTTENVVGLLQVTDTSNAEYLVMGAHYDHLGMGGEGSLEPDKIAIHHGADDNASGTAGIIELAREMSGEKSLLRRNVEFISFSGEEEGLLGSQYYVTHPTLNIGNAVAMINLDMVGRLKDRALTVQGTGTSSRWDTLLSLINADSALILKRVKDGFGPSDHSSFYGAGIPILFFFTGIHEDYHKSSDVAEKINYEGEASVLAYIAKVAVDVDDHTPRPDYLKTQAASTSGGDSRGLRAYVGTVPDFSENVEGMKITSVRDNSPAAKGGLQGGDIIVKFGKFDVKNIYDYTYAIQDYKPGDNVDVVVKRGNELLTKRLKLEKRK
ncbi:MAG TPA: M28 family peptidase [Bacteroidota bacterium]|nr:M28 family peptidase [Bacteroidota bacterium]